ncbi:MAG: hypothetical protein HC888_10300 [Candidatus Competibacteraceae bacterium]|nr:hypothetical protein [Candidatus Competibacteraceae bacterium]
MVHFIHEQEGLRPAIVADGADRLCRSIKDWVMIEELGVDMHLVKEGKVISPSALSSDRSHHGIQVLMAKHYIDNLRALVSTQDYERVQVILTCRSQTSAEMVDHESQA